MADLSDKMDYKNMSEFVSNKPLFLGSSQKHRVKTGWVTLETIYWGAIYFFVT